MKRNEKSFLLLELKRIKAMRYYHELISCDCLTPSDARRRMELLMKIYERLLFAEGKRIVTLVDVLYHSEYPNSVMAHTYVDHLRNNDPGNWLDIPYRMAMYFGIDSREHFWINILQKKWQLLLEMLLGQ